MDPLRRARDRLAAVDRRWWLHGAAAVTTLGLIAVVLTTGDNPRVGLEGWCSDHYSHTLSTVLFLDHGMEVYRRPVGALCEPSRRRWRERRALARRLRVNPVDLCWPRRSTHGRPLVINWQKFPRPYPPGVMLYFLPEALLYRHAGASFETVNRVTIVKLALVAHLAWVVLVLLLADLRPRGIAWVLMGLGYSQLMYWGLVGIYDGVALLAVLSALLALKRRRWLLAILAFGAACFLHFRALWYAPLLVPAVHLAVTRGELPWSGIRSGIPRPLAHRIRSGIWLGSALALMGSALYVFHLLYPALRAFPVRNALFHETLAWTSPHAMAYLVPTLGVLILLAWRRLWLAAGLLAWMTLFLLRTPQIMTWHSLFLLPFLVLAATSPPDERPAEQAFASLLWYLAAATLVFKVSIWPAWLSSVLTRLQQG